MSEVDFSRAAACERTDSDSFLLHLPPSWAQGRGTFGGVVIGGMVNAVRAVETDTERTVRAIDAQILAPVAAGTAVLWVTELRRGNALSAYSVELRPAIEGGKDQPVLAAATVTLAKLRTSDGFTIAAPPTMAPIDTLTAAPVVPPIAPVFTQHVEFFVTGPAPFSSSPVAAIEGWARLKEASEWGPAEIVALADAYWPSVLAQASAPKPVVTVGFGLHLFRMPPKGPLYIRGRAVAGQDGYVSEEREVWAPDGTLVARNTQLFAVV